MLKEGQNSTLYRVLKDFVPKAVVSNKNRNRSWLYGYNPKYDVVVISKTGQIGDVIEISGLKIALPKAPKECLQRHTEKKQQYLSLIHI